MAFSYREYIADGSTDSFALPFDYIAAADISVYVDGVEDTSFTFTSPSTIQTSSMPSSGVVVRVERNTELEERLVDFASGSVLTEEDLDNANIQVFYAAQEAIDAAGESVAKDLDGVLDAQNRRIKNLADPINDQDAVTKSWAEDGMTSQLNIAEGYKNTAVSSAATATTKAAEAATSASNAASSASNASTSATNAAQDASDAAVSETAAAGSATSASNSATAAATSASNASTSATNAANSATSASGSASAAANSATAAATSEDNAADSETAAATSETNAANSATAAAGSATASANSANASATSATNSANSATASANSATASANSATAAASSASDAATSESNAANSATAAASSASSAATSASAAQAAEDAALAALDSFDDRYLGQKATAPSTDNDGDALVAGALYFNTSDSTMKVYDGSTWVAAYASASGALQETGGTMTGNLSFGDSVKALFGASNDLQIYHDGSHSVILDNGTGHLQLKCEDFRLQSTGGVNTLTADTSTGYVGIGTTSPSTALDVTGTVTADGLTVEYPYYIDTTQIFSDTNLIFKIDADNNQTGRTFSIKNGADELVFLADQGGDISFYEDTGTTPKFFWDASAESLSLTTIGTEALDITSTTGAAEIRMGNSNSSYDIRFGAADKASGIAEFFVETGGTEAMRIDFSGNVGIGTNTPNSTLTVRGDNTSAFSSTNMPYTGDGMLEIINGDVTNANTYCGISFQAYGTGYNTNRSCIVNVSTSNNTDGTLVFGTRGAGYGNIIERMRIDSSGNVGIGTNSPTAKLHLDGSNPNLVFGSSGTELTYLQRYGDDFYVFNKEATGSMLFGTANTERMRIDSSGNLLVGKTSSNISTVGHEFLPNGTANHTKDGGNALRVNRLTSDGEIIDIRKDGSTKGSIGTDAIASHLYIQGLTTNSGIRFSAAGILPLRNALAVDNTLDLGSSTYRWQDLYLSGDMFVNAGYGSSAKAYGCRAWVNFNGTGTVAIREDGNVSSITDHGTGQYSINFSSAMPDANYSIVGGTIGSNGNWAYNIRTNNSSISASSARFSTGFSNANELYDIPYIHLAVFR